MRRTRPTSTIPSEFPRAIPHGTRYRLVCIDDALIPWLFAAVRRYATRRSGWQSDDFLEARQALLRFLESLMSDCGLGIKEMGALLAVMAGLQEQPIADVKNTFPVLGTELEAAQGRATGGLLNQQSDIKKFSNITRLSELIRVLQGAPPTEWWQWWGWGEREYTTLFDLLRNNAAGAEVTVDDGGTEKELISYISDAVSNQDNGSAIMATLFGSAVNAGVSGAGSLVKGSMDSVQIILLAGIVGELVGLAAGIRTLNNNLGVVATGVGTVTDNQSQMDLNDNLRNDRLLNVLGGAEATANPQTLSDNIMRALRGDTPADANRNVIDTQAGSAIVSLEDKLDDLLRGSQLSGGRVNLWTLDQSIADVISHITGVTSELQTGEIYNILNILTDPSLDPGSGFVTLNDIWGQIAYITLDQSIAGRVNLHDIYQQMQVYQALLECICTNAKYIPDILEQMPSENPYDGAPVDSDTTIVTTGNLCQRARFLLDKLSSVAKAMLAPRSTTRRAIYDAYNKFLDSPIDAEHASELAIWLNRLRKQYEKRSPGAALVDFLQYISDHTEDFVCAVYDGSSASQAHGNWNIMADQLGADDDVMAAVMKRMLPQNIINAIMAEELPLDPSVLDGYSSDCSGCGGTGGGGCTEVFSYTMELGTPDDSQVYLVFVPNAGEDDVHYYFLSFNPSGARPLGEASNSTGSINSGAFQRRIFCNLAGWKIRVLYSQTQLVDDPAYRIKYAVDPQDSVDMQAGIELTTSWQTIPAGSHVCVYNGPKNATGPGTAALEPVSWNVIQLCSP